MGHLLHVKPFPSPPPPPHSGDLKIIKIKHLLHSFVLKHGGRLAVALGGAKALLLNIARGSVSLRDKIKRRKKTKKPRCHGGSGNDGDTMTMHLKLLLPAGVPPLTPSETAVVEPFDAELAYYDSSWNTMVPAEEQLLRPISGYLSWPEQEEEEEENQGEDEGEDEQNEIDRLADKFIARCHERFMLEKQESYRRFHEMLARSL